MLPWERASLSTAGRACQTSAPVAYNGAVRPFLPAIFVVATAFGCAQPQPTAQQRFPLRGTVVATDESARTATIAHDEIPGYMDAMTMTLPVGGGVELRTIAMGDRVSATLVVDGDGSRFEDVVRLEPGEATEYTTASDPQEGQPAPDFALTGQDGARVNLARYRGSTLALTFIYTRCPLPDFCALMTDHFAAAAKTFRQEPALAARMRLLSITIDPARDTPAVLAEYGRKAVAPAVPDFALWSLATGDDKEVRRVAASYGLSSELRSGQIVHSLRTAVIAPDGRLVKLLRGNKWTAEELIQIMRNTDRNYRAN